jgi:hypothetical protein
MPRKQEFMVCRVNLGVLDKAGVLQFVSAVADTGASNTIVDLKFYEKFLENTRNVIRVERFDDPLNLAAANNGVLRIDRLAIMRLYVTKQTS